MKEIKRTCITCEKKFKINIKSFKHDIKRGRRAAIFCSRKCKSIKEKKSQKIECKNCGRNIIKEISQIKKSKTGNHFCCLSCSTIYNNTHKSKGYRRSKLEKWIEKNLKKTYPKLEMHFNRKDTIDSELDIFIPDLNLAFELNGIFHYKPIYGEDKLNQIQNNDKKKNQICFEKNIHLCLIDVSSMINFKEDKAKTYFQMIENKIAGMLKLVDKSDLKSDG